MLAETARDSVRSLILGAAFLLGAAGIMAARAASGESSQHAEDQSIGYMEALTRIPGPDEPLLIEGTVVTLEEAADLAGFPITRPQHSLASDSLLTEVWINEDTREVALRYSTGVLVYIAFWPGPDSEENASAFYQTQSVEDADLKAVEVNGYPGLLIPKSAHAENYPPTDVLQMVVGTSEVRIKAAIPLDQIMEIAESIA